jgi:hypothetical protein
MFLTTLCLSLSMSNALALNFTVICMFKPVTDDDEALMLMGNNGNLTTASLSGLSI